MTETIINTIEKQRNDLSLPMLHDKRVIADTSALLAAGTGILKDIPSCELVIPSVVISELEEKRTHSTLGFLARQWLRLLEQFRANDALALKDGASIPDHPHVTLRVEPNHTSQKSLPEHLRDGSNDKTILSVANNFVIEDKEKEDKDNTVLLTNDMPMRIHATLELGVSATGYDYASVNKIRPFSGVRTILVDEEEAEGIYSNAEGIKYYNSLPVSVLQKIDDQTRGIENCVLRLMLNTSEEDVCSVMKSGEDIVDIDLDLSASGIEGRTVQQAVALNYLMEDSTSLPITSLGGSAGTGKTLLALAAGIDGVETGKYDKVIVLRSLHEMGQGQDLGFLPGTADEKMQPWAGAVHDALRAINKQSKKKSKKRSESEPVHTAEEDNVAKYKDIIEVSPITYLRGRSLTDSYIIIEEAQNFSFSELLNILSRVGQDSKVVLTFDQAQVDNKFLRSGDKADVWSVIDKMKASDLFGHIDLVKTERSKVADIASRVLEGKF